MSLSATEGIKGKRTMKLHGLVNNQDILILVDSGSSGTFISVDAVERLKCPTQPVPSVQVTTANDGQLSSDKMVPEICWYTQGHTFSSAPRVLELNLYDLILGMDWPEQYSPMWVD